MKTNTKKIIISGSIVYDRIMDFPGRFKDHILPEKVHILNISFLVQNIKESFGGTAGNIAYNLALLGEKPMLVGALGKDGKNYLDWFKKLKINTRHIKKFDSELSSSCSITTDMDDNQITAFFPGPLDVKYCESIKNIKNIEIAIISPELKTRMLKYAVYYTQAKIPYIFDPGQQITSLSKKDLEISLKGAKILIGNDYEIELILNKLNLEISVLIKKINTLIITKGSQGSEIYNESKRIAIPPAKPKKIADPTGAGDAYRAGLIKGLITGWPLEKVGRFASLVAVYAVENYGTQEHRFSWQELERRYRENFKENL